MQAKLILMQRRRTLRWLLGGAGCLTLFGCGGGGGDELASPAQAEGTAAGPDSSPLQATVDETRYALVDLGSLASGLGSLGFELNQRGGVTGSASLTAQQSHAFLYRDGTLQDLGTLGGRFSQGRGVSNAGLVCGISERSDGVVRAFLHDGVMHDIGTLGGEGAVAEDMAANGRITGGADRADGVRHAYVYRNGLMSDLGTLGGSFSTGLGINNAGRVTGSAQTPDEALHAFLHDGRAMRDLGTLGGVESVGIAINERGWVTGISTTEELGVQHAFLYDGSRMRDLGSLPGEFAPFSIGYGINARGWVVGSANAASLAVSHAFVHDGVSLHDLNDLLDGSAGWLVTEARDINNAGTIVGSARPPGGNPPLRAVLLTPVPGG